MAAKNDLPSATGLYGVREQDTSWGQGQMSLASLFKPGDKGGFIDVVNKFPWTLSPNWVKSEAPYVILKEFEFNEGQILSSVSRFIGAAWDAVKGTFGGDFDSLEAYQQLFPKDKPTDFVYQLPYFSDINFSVRSEPWKDLASISEIGGAASEGLGVGKELQERMSTYAGAGKLALDIIGGYPITSPTDKPKMWSAHTPRTFEVKFPLFNTLNPDDWLLNRDLCVLLVNQNLYNKRDYVTALPPVFYEVLIPGQHYSYAACVTDITIYNRGNMRVLNSSKEKGKAPAVVPDAYEVSISLTDLTMPSKNLFQQISNPKVFTEIVKTD